MARKVKEKRSGSRKVREKVQTAPKELLRRGLLTGAEKLKGQLRDAAEGGRREDTEADSAQDTAQRGARLAVDKLGRLARRKERTWSGTMEGGAEAPKAYEAHSNVPDGTSASTEQTAPPVNGEPVRIKTREARLGVSLMGYRTPSRQPASPSGQPMVKTEENYSRNQTVERNATRRRTGPTLQTGEYIHTEQPSLPVIRTKGHCIYRYTAGPEIPGRNGRIVEHSPAHPSQGQERGGQRFVRERARQVAAKRATGQIVSTPSEQRGVVDVPPQASPSGFVRTGAPASPKTVWETHSGGNRSIKRTRSERAPVGKSVYQKIKSTADAPGQVVQTADYSANATRQTACTVVQARQRTLRAAGGARQAVATVDRPVVKATAPALRGAVSGIRAAMAPLAAGGGAVVTVVLVLCLVAALIMSPLGIFFSGEETGGQTVSDAVREINQGYSAKLEELKSGSTYDQLSMTGTRAPWPEVLAVYAVKTTSDPTGGQEVVTMTDEKKELLKQVFWEMNQVGSFTSTVPGEDGEEDTTTLHITVTAKTTDEMADTYGFNTSQRQQLAELLSDKYRELWNAVLYGISSGSGEIVAVALSQVGNVGGQPYWSWYGFSHRVEWCAIFVSWCANECGYIDAGVIPKFAGCVQGSRWFKDRGLWQDKSHTPNPGDIIFFDWNDSGGLSGPQDGVPDHVGIVEKVENGRVYTVEGNSGDKCCQRSYPVGYYEIYGYGTPYP